MRWMMKNEEGRRLPRLDLQVGEQHALQEVVVVVVREGDRLERAGPVFLQRLPPGAVLHCAADVIL